MGIIRYPGSKAHAPECECVNCVILRRTRRLTTAELEAKLISEEIERRADEYRQQTRCHPASSDPHQPNTQPNRTEEMHSGMPSVSSDRETINLLDQSYDKPYPDKPYFSEYIDVMANYMLGKRLSHLLYPTPEIQLC